MIMRTVSVTEPRLDEDPAMTTIGSPGLAKPVLLELRHRVVAQPVDVLEGSHEGLLDAPRAAQLAVRSTTFGVRATIGMGGRKREIARAVRPERVHATMATAFSSMAARHAAPVMAAVTRWA